MVGPETHTEKTPRTPDSYLDDITAASQAIVNDVIWESTDLGASPGRIDTSDSVFRAHWGERQPSKDYDLLSLHFGRGVLSVVMERSFLQNLPVAQRDVTEYQRATLVIENGRATVHAMDDFRLGPSEDITENEGLTEAISKRFFSTLGLVGLHGYEPVRPLVLIPGERDQQEPRHEHYQEHQQFEQKAS